MSDVWQRQFAIATGDISGNPDGDQFTNLEESRLGSNPHVHNSPVAAAFIGDQCAALVTTVQGVRYEVQYSTSLQPDDWQAVLSPLTGNGQPIAIEIAGHTRQNTTHLFYRIKSLVSVDDDGDGLDAMEEGILGSSELDSDSDDDKVSDVAEFRAMLNPASAASTDGDLIPDDWERVRIGNLNSTGSQDTDDDGFTTMDEFTFDLNPGANDFANGTGIKSHAFTFDAGGQLKGVAGTLSETFDYDADGNIFTSN